MNTIGISQGDIIVDERGRVPLRTGINKVGQDIEEALISDANLKEILGQPYGLGKGELAYIQDRVNTALANYLAHQSNNSSILSPGERIRVITDKVVTRVDYSTVLIYFRVVTDEGIIEKQLRFSTGGAF